MNKAKYKGKWCEKGYHGISTPHLIYEYRGREYEVVDYKFNTVETLAAQHRKEQEKIDKAIEEELKPKKNTVTKTRQNTHLNKFLIIGKRGK